VNRALKKIWNDEARLTAWTNAQLEGPIDDLEYKLDDNTRLADHIIDEGLRDYLLQLKEKNVDRFVELIAANPDWRRYVRRRAPGRPRGGKLGLREALADVARISELWRKTFGTHYRKTAPTAIAVAARRHGIAPTELENYRANRRKLKAK
jgi:hypothetical protein